MRKQSFKPEASQRSHASLLVPLLPCEIRIYRTPLAATLRSRSPAPPLHLIFNGMSLSWDHIFLTDPST